jgi:hypothetical protein
MWDKLDADAYSASKKTWHSTVGRCSVMVKANIWIHKMTVFLLRSYEELKHYH